MNGTTSRLRGTLPWIFTVTGILVWSSGCSPWRSGPAAIEKTATDGLAVRPALASISHFPAVPWEGEDILARARFTRLPEGSTVRVAIRGVAGTLAGKTGGGTLQRDPNPDSFTGEIVYRGQMATGLQPGDAFAYRIEVTPPDGGDPWVSYEEPVLVSAGGTELRGTWVQTWSPVICTPEQCRELIDNVRRANLNLICVEIRRRADTFYNSAFEPKADSIVPPDFDPLAELIRLAHDTSGGNPRVEVHGWFVIYRAGTGEVAKKHPDWATRLHNGAPPPDEVVFDPGHPEVLQYLVDVIRDCVGKYDLDGVNYDYVRYMEAARRPKAEALAQFRKEKNLPDNEPIDFNGDTWKTWSQEQPDDAVYETVDMGYNPVSILRFNRILGLPGASIPEADNEAWNQWRCDQVTAFVRKAYMAINQVRPSCVVSADTTGFGGISTWQTAAPRNAVFQDWVAWMRDHYLDANFHMGYKREHVEQQKTDYRTWSRFMVDTDGGRYAVIGQGSYLNAPEAYREQVEFARRQRAPGILYYSYQGYAPRSAEMTLAQWLDWARERLYPKPVPAPVLAWKRYPTCGMVQGTLVRDGRPVDGARVYLTTPEGTLPSGLIGTPLRTFTDGTGFFGFTRVPPGEYAVVVVDRDGKATRSKRVAVAPGTLVDAF